MKRNKAKFLIVVLAVLLLFSGCINQEEEEGTKPIDVSGVDKNAIGSYQTMKYEDLTNVDVASLTTNLSSTYLILANKQSELESTYVPSPLVELTCATLQPDRTYELEARAAKALYAMLAEMKAAGISDVMVASAYRSYSYQIATYNGYVDEEMSHISQNARRLFGEDYIKMNYLDKGIYQLNIEDAHIVVQSYSAVPGQSEHQTGLCLDFASGEEDEYLTEAFENTQAFAWLSENAYKFGFILRYPKGMEHITGYTYEPWHYRFVGREAATDIFVGDMTLEQYLQLTAQ